MTTDLTDHSVADAPSSAERSFDYDTWFEPLVLASRHPAVDEALRYADACRIQDHEFFRVAAQSRDALRLWVGQELVVTGAFSQELLLMAASLPNVHMRAMLMEVIIGEHGRATNGCAKRSHPWLLDSLRESMALDRGDVQPCGATVRFLERLRAERTHQLSYLAALGVGNERLILAEYSAVKGSFASCWPTADHAAFLDANIHEDMRHSELVSDVASTLIRTAEDGDRYYEAAVRSVKSRIIYYDELTELVIQ